MQNISIEIEKKNVGIYKLTRKAKIVLNTYAAHTCKVLFSYNVWLMSLHKWF